MTYIEHLEELRRRLIISFIAILAMTVVCFLFAEELFKILISPLLYALPENKQRLIFTNLPEAFIAHLKIAFVAGLFVSSPIVLLQIWKFIAPGLYPHEKRYAFPFVFFSSSFFMIGGLFCFKQVFPWGFKFFLSFGNEYIEALPKISEYITFSLKLIVVFGLIFQLPILMYFLAKIGLVSGQLLSKNRKYAIMVIFIVAAILTPPDVITQFMLAGPLIILYEISIVIARVVGRNRARKEKELHSNEVEEEPPAEHNTKQNGGTEKGI
ncbi:twin-arginine translocase subunit TatC [candidate division CSSED10-310 bacterium]|uniref:Sec-independent protein translocase protein TatC n=1 Tax=candidate division CSSED10-310 bacterium TaxID=2855610 RepID=A0ABV6Z0N5_UNCC1